MTLTNIDVRKAAKSYMDRYPDDVRGLKSLVDLMSEGIDITTRAEMRGHVTASAVVVNDAGFVLLVNHVATGQWIQPGGHPEAGDHSLSDTAKREAHEETGIHPALLKLAFTRPIHVDSHVIPERPEKQEQAHRHWDFRYLFWTSARVGEIQPDEVGGAGFFSVNSLPGDVLRERVRLAMN
ncbi:NUDIX hydrolase [Saccharopolyspora elongata]|uniref:NUDIX domain-containing protein n=1 Tax=Saccharopolyspora elongata TaxID=2530387 RepID=A0A4R4YAB7_9PSEU|nr:NUDIX domain-containing protein [Saccharopolyspora elongata]TDD41356.1 NUDIX domain-containing protein [Saccharopolyspora elongata]